MHNYYTSVNSYDSGEDSAEAVRPITWAYFRLENSIEKNKNAKAHNKHLQHLRYSLSILAQVWCQ